MSVFRKFDRVFDRISNQRIRDEIHERFMTRRRHHLEAALTPPELGERRVEAPLTVPEEKLLAWAARNAEGSLRMTSELLDPSPPGRKGHFMRLSSGTKFWPLDPRPEEVFIDDIAKSLSKLCRFNGHPAGDRFYSVAEHSVWCSLYVPEEHALEALMHDAAEAYTGDLIRPIKVIPEIAAVFKPIEHLVDVAVATRFDLRFPFDPSIKDADEAVCTRELRTIMNGADPNRGACEGGTITEAPYTLGCVPPHMAEHAFVGRFIELMEARNRRRWLRHEEGKVIAPMSFVSPYAREFATA